MCANGLDVDFWQIFFEDVKFWQKKSSPVISELCIEF